MTPSQSTPPGKYVAVVNPISGRRNMTPLIEKVGALLRQRGVELDIRFTAGPGDATQIASTLRTDTKAVIVAGGDGTVFETMNGLTDPKTPLLILRTGTENLLGRELGTPLRASRIVETIISGRVINRDAGRLNAKRFLVVAGIGFDAECVIRMNKVRRGHITHGDYFWPIWRTFWSHRFPRLVIEADGRRVFDDRGLALIGVAPQYSVGLRVLARARPDDGLLDLIALPCGSKIRLLVHAGRVFLHRHVANPSVVYGQYNKIRITSPDHVPVEADGELVGGLPVECETEPASARFLISSTSPSS